MQEKELYKMINEKEATIASASFPALMRKVYTWMALALVITGVTAYGVAHSPAMMQLIYGNSLVMWGLIIVELALVFIVSGMINRLSLTTATLLFILYSVVNGATLSVIFLGYSQSVIAKTFFITAGMFGAMSFYGYVTKQDLSSIGKILFVELLIPCA
jgi:FtsH-binding integral membrane protein